MTTFKKAAQGIVAQSFICANTVKVGDTVCITADNTVGHSATGIPIGEVVAVDSTLIRCTVELYSSKIETAIAEGAGIVAGSLLKVGSARTLVSLGATTVAADVRLHVGVAFAAAVATAPVTYMTFT